MSHKCGCNSRCDCGCEPTRSYGYEAIYRPAYGPGYGPGFGPGFGPGYGFGGGCENLLLPLLLIVGATSFGRRRY